jgi:hypothetical protein
LADLATALRAVAYETAFGVIEHVDDGHDPAAPDDAPGWVLMIRTAATPSVARFATPRVPSQPMTHLPTRPLGPLGMRPARGF